MNNVIWRICSVGVLGLFLGGWAGTAAAAEWANPDLLVTPETVKENIDKADWVVVDCRDLKDYAKGHIPGAISLGKRCKKAFRDATARVLTDATVGFWVLEYLGHDKAHVLNGGLDAWRKAGNRLDNTPVKESPAEFKVNVVASRYATTDEILQIAAGEAESTQLVDSRSKDEFTGKKMSAIRGGHIPNVTMNASHVDTVLHVKDEKSGDMKATGYLDPDTAISAFGELDKSQRTIGYCQTGTRSTMTYLQFRLLGFENPANWDESWRVYGSQLSYPVEGEQWYNFAGLNKKIASLEKKVKALEKAAKN
jgi:thiosulfate/3-mercaptopyruvate sulfurtransferase